MLADHGHTVADEPLGVVPEPAYRLAPPASCDPCLREAPRFAPPRFGPRLSLRLVTQAELLDSALPAVLSLRQEPARALPQVALTSSLGSHLWTARRDLLASGPFADELVAEIKADGTAQIRFGDDINGHRPEPGTAFAATYRVGSGPFRTQERTVTREDYAEVVDRAGPVPAPDRRQRTCPFCQYHAA